MRVSTYIFTSWFPNLWIQAMGETAPYLGCWFRAYSTSGRSALPDIDMYYSWLSNWITKRPSTLLGQLLQGDGLHDQTSEFHAYQPIAAFSMVWNEFFFCVCVFFVGRDGICNTMMVDKAVCKSTNCSFATSIAGKEGKATFGVSLYTCENKINTHSGGR